MLFVVSLSPLKFMNQLTDFYKLGMTIMTLDSSSMTSHFNFRTVGVNMAGANLWGAGGVDGGSTNAA